MDNNNYYILLHLSCITMALFIESIITNICEQINCGLQRYWPDKYSLQIFTLLLFLVIYLAPPLKNVTITFILQNAIK